MSQQAQSLMKDKKFLRYFWIHEWAVAEIKKIFIDYGEIHVVFDDDHKIVLTPLKGHEWLKYKQYNPLKDHDEYYQMEVDEKLVFWNDCKYCGKNKKKLKICKKCKKTMYCSRGCQKRDWNKGNHKNVCDILKNL